jgi:hypothetical protein
MRAGLFSERAFLLDASSSAAQVGVCGGEAAGMLTEDRAARRTRIVIRLIGIVLLIWIAVAFVEAVYSMKREGGCRTSSSNWKRKSGESARFSRS